MGCKKTRWNLGRILRSTGAVACLLAASMAYAAEQSGRVMFNGLPVPGATITATQGSKKVVTVSDADGNYRFPDLADGAWKVHVEMLFFTPQELDVNVA